MYIQEVGGSSFLLDIEEFCLRALVSRCCSSFDWGFDRHIWFGEGGASFAIRKHTGAYKLGEGAIREVIKQGERPVWGMQVGEGLALRGRHSYGRIQHPKP